MLRIASEALTFDDVLLLPAYSDTLPSETQLETRLTRQISLNIPLVSSAMDTVTESRLAIAMAQEGGIGIVHKNMPIEQQAREVHAVKKFESGIIRDPITIHPDQSVRQLLELTMERSISGVPVVEGTQLVGIITSRDVVQGSLVWQFDAGKWFGSHNLATNAPTPNTPRPPPAMMRCGSMRRLTKNPRRSPMPSSAVRILRPPTRATSPMSRGRTRRISPGNIPPRDS